MGYDIEGMAQVAGAHCAGMKIDTADILGRYSGKYEGLLVCVWNGDKP
jgi:hypothetical protein